MNDLDVPLGSFRSERGFHAHFGLGTTNCFDSFPVLRFRKRSQTAQFDIFPPVHCFRRNFFIVKQKKRFQAHENYGLGMNSGKTQPGHLQSPRTQGTIRLSCWIDDFDDWATSEELPTGLCTHSKKADPFGSAFFVPIQSLLRHDHQPNGRACLGDHLGVGLQFEVRLVGHRELRL